MKFSYSTITLMISSIFFVYEIVGDIQEGETFIHWYTEASMFLLVTSAFLYKIYQTKKLKESLIEHEQELNSLKGDIGESIKLQFNEWKLSTAESEVAWLIIKGFSFNDISSFRSVTDKTIRKQAAKIYQKASVNNRSEFTASFLEDLMTKKYATT